MKTRLVVLASGRGTNFAAISNAVVEGKIPDVEIIALVSNNPEAGALTVAKQFKIPTFVVDSTPHKRTGKFQRAQYEGELVKILEQLTPDYILLAGYMLIVGEDVIQRWPNRMINIHPSLLPAFKGLRAQKQALEAGAKETGCTVHFVTSELDSGPIILQNRIPILPNDTEESLSSRLLEVEHRTYVDALTRLCAERRKTNPK